MKKVILQTYLFWALFSLYNLPFLIILTFPPLLMIPTDFYAKFAPFILPPLLFSLILAIIIFLLVERKISQKIKKISPLLFNGLFLIIFLLSTDIYKNILIKKEAKKYNIKFVYTRPFYQSIAFAGEEYQFNSHAGFIKDGKLYFWSYRDRNFYVCPEDARSNVALPKQKFFIEN